MRKKLKDRIAFRCNGEHCRKKLGMIDPSTGFLYQESNRWHFDNIIKEAIIICHCGWQTEYKHKDFINMEG